MSSTLKPHLIDDSSVWLRADCWQPYWLSQRTTIYSYFCITLQVSGRLRKTLRYAEI